ncbi:MAG TPA: pitrilysin family protein [Thermoanaerobaculaceae bacterium]|nr:pitrilysin family protein [Thermoanaerobaculaceae bacterium]
MKGAPVLLVEAMPKAPTAAVGAWLRCGSAHEGKEVAGITHLIEHLLLRRCGGRTPEAIAEEIDSLGGAVDAFTTRETCAVTAHVPAERFEEALALVLDAAFAPRFLPDEVELERRVVAAEFDMVQDSPAEVAAEEALAACWGDHPLARPVLGRREVVDRLGVDALGRFHRERFVADNLLLVAVGPVDEARLRERVAALPAGGVQHPPLAAPAWHRGVTTEEREGLEQVYADLVLPALPADDPEILTLGVLHQLLGGGAASRLFRELRDRLGLVYDVGSSIYATAAAGVLEVEFSAPVRQAGACWDAVFRVLERVAAGEVSDREVELARRGLVAGVTLGAEGTDAMMEALAGEYLSRGRRFDAAEVRRELEAVTPERVRALAARVVRLDAISGSVCGPRAGLQLPSGVARRVA